MTHNINKLNGVKPDIAGDISQSLGDLSDVSSDAPTDGHYLVYDDASAEWQPSAVQEGPSNSVPHIWLGEGASQTYPEAWSSGNGVYYYSTSVVNTITDASVSSTDSFSNWYDKLVLPSGTYLAYTRVEGDFSNSTGVFQYMFKSTPTAGGSTVSHAASGWSASSANTSQNPEIAQALFELSAESNVVVTLQNTSSLGTASTNQSLYGFLFVMKVG